MVKAQPADLAGRFSMQLFDLPITQFIFYLWQAAALGLLTDEQAQELYAMWLGRNNNGSDHLH